MKRRVDIDAISKTAFDIIIIGGGITGAGILNEASKRGYKCLLLDKGDFASGTSSKSAKLIHGGIRYLKHGQFKVIRESLKERNYLLETYPHLVKPIPFLFPIYETKYLYYPGIALYNFLGGKDKLPDYRFLEKEDTIKMLPNIRDENLKGSFIYFDAITNDARLCNEVIDDAIKSNHFFAANYCEVNGIKKNNSGIQINCTDHIENREVSFQAKYLVNASGVWTDEVLKMFSGKSNQHNAPSKGVHLILSKKRFPIQTAVIVPSYAGDKRMNYAIPWENDSVIFGTTDTDYSGDINRPDHQQADIDYLLHSLNKFVTGMNFNYSDILFVYSGLRPLLKGKESSSNRSRDYSIWWEKDFILNISGGKLTSFHSMATSLVQELLKKHRPSASSLAQHKIPEADSSETLPDEFVTRIREIFFDKAHEIFSLAKADLSLAALLHADFDVTLAEVVYYIRYRQCYHLDDLMTRRLSLTYVLNACKQKEQVIRKVADIMKKECGWSDEEFKMEIDAYRNILDASLTTTSKI